VRIILIERHETSLHAMRSLARSTPLKRTGVAHDFISLELLYGSELTDSASVQKSGRVGGVVGAGVCESFGGGAKSEVT